MIRFQCPDCKTTLGIASAQAATQVLCPTCKIRIIVPTAAKLGIFIEEYQDPNEKYRRDDPMPVVVAESPSPNPSLTPPLPLPPLELPTEKDWRSEPPLPFALPDDTPANDNQRKEDDFEDDEDENEGDYRPRKRRRARHVGNISLLPATLLVVGEAIFGAVALAIACVAFLRIR